jgi:hypothetical protein
MNGNITREGITADLEAMKRVELGGAQIFNVSDIPEGPVEFMSPLWLDLLQHAAAVEGARDLHHLEALSKGQHTAAFRPARPGDPAHGRLGGCEVNICRG